MRLLISTQVVDEQDPVLGFFVAWIREFAKHCESVEVTCLRDGTYSLPENVHVHSLGKEHGRRSQFSYVVRYLTLISTLRKKYDAVFVHMNSEYMVLGGLFWRIWGKQSVLWYTHKQVSATLRIATMFAHRVLTASKESFRLATNKLIVMGHGIDTDLFIPVSGKVSTHRLVTIGRIAASKGLEVLLECMQLLGEEYSLDIIGVAVQSEDFQYEKKLRSTIEERTMPITFIGSMLHEELPKQLPTYGLFLHASTGTGSLDKAVLESLASGVPVVSTSPAFKDILEPYSLVAHDTLSLKESVERYTKLPEEEQKNIQTSLRSYVVTNHSLASLIPRIIATLRP